MIDGQLLPSRKAPAVLASKPVSNVDISSIEPDGAGRASLIVLEDDNGGHLKIESWSVNDVVTALLIVPTLRQGSPAFEIEGLVILGNDLGHALVKKRDRTSNRANVNGEPMPIQDKYGSVCDLRHRDTFIRPNPDPWHRTLEESSRVTDVQSLA